MTQKYEREIEEILRNLDGFVPDEPAHRRVSRDVAQRFAQAASPLREWRRYLTVQWFMVASIALVMAAFLMRAISPTIASYMNLLGLILFVTALAMSIFRWNGMKRRRSWRGRVIDISARDSNWWRSLQRRWRLWRRRF